jgi:hypothetical protein
MRHRAIASILSERVVSSLASRCVEYGGVIAKVPVSKPSVNLHPSVFRVKSVTSPPPPRTFGTSTAIDGAAAKEYQAFLESLSPAQKKFLAVLHEYRSKNFEHTMPKRFFQMIIKAVDSNHDGVITLEEYQTLLTNIGAREKMTDQDLDEIFEKLGDDVLGAKVISVKRIETAWAPFLNVIWKI